MQGTEIVRSNIVLLCPGTSVEVRAADDLTLGKGLISLRWYCSGSDGLCTLDCSQFDSRAYPVIVVGVELCLVVGVVSELWASTFGQRESMNTYVLSRQNVVKWLCSLGIRSLLLELYL